MPHRTLPLTATDDEIRGLVVEWSELLADKRYADALAMFPSCEQDCVWTPDLLQQTIAGYGAVEGDPETLAHLHRRHGVERFEITSLRARPDFNDIVARWIDVDRENLYGLDPAGYLGMVHYDNVPLSGKPSDLTARFHIQRVGADRLTLEFLDLHVM